MQVYFQNQHSAFELQQFTDAEAQIEIYSLGFSWGLLQTNLHSTEWKSLKVSPCLEMSGGQEVMQQQAAQSKGRPPPATLVLKVELQPTWRRNNLHWFWHVSRSACPSLPGVSRSWTASAGQREVTTEWFLLQEAISSLQCCFHIHHSLTHISGFSLGFVLIWSTKEKKDWSYCCFFYW